MKDAGSLQIQLLWCCSDQVSSYWKSLSGHDSKAVEIQQALIPINPFLLTTKTAGLNASTNYRKLVLMLLEVSGRSPV